MKKKIVAYAMVVLISSSIFNFTSFAWASNESISRESTHTILVEQGLTVLFNDLSPEDRENEQFFDVINRLQGNYLKELKEGSVAPDFSSQSYSLFQDHFYDPDTKVNFSAFSDGEVTFLDYINETAESRTREYVAEAVYQWRLGNYSESANYLGMAMHFYTDLCEPHHGSNAIGGTRECSTKHSAFEAYVDDRNDRYLISTAGDVTTSSVYADALDDYFIADFLRNESQASSTIAKSSYKNDFNPRDEATFDGVAKNTMALAQRGVARILYRFAKEVSKPYEGSGDTTNFNVRVKTKSGKLTECYGTDNDVFFGVELKDGRIKEWKFDKSWYNDFENGDNDTYAIQIEGAKGTDIRKIWLRKQRGWQAGTAEDNWYPEEVEVISEDQSFNYFRTIDQWLTGNNGYYIDIESEDMILFPNI